MRLDEATETRGRGLRAGSWWQEGEERESSTEQCLAEAGARGSQGEKSSSPRTVLALLT